MNFFKNKKIIITIIVIGVIIVAGYGFFRFFNERNQGEVNHIDHFTKSSTVSEVMNNASFKGFGNLIFSVDRTSSPNYLVTMELQIASFIVYKRLISYRGLVKWYNNGLQNLCWVFDIDKRCHRRKKTLIFFRFGSFTFFIINLFLYCFISTVS